MKGRKWRGGKEKEIFSKELQYLTDIQVTKGLKSVSSGSAGKLFGITDGKNGRTRELIRQAERRARFQARRSACREVRFRRTGCPRRARRFSGRKARQNSRIGANVPFFRNGACGVRQRARAPAGAPRRFLMPPGFFIIMLKGAEGGKNVRGRQIFPFPPERKKFFKKSGKTESKTA